MSRKWWNERTLMEKCLFLGLIVTALIIISLIVTLIVLLPKKNIQSQRKGQLIQYTNDLKKKGLDLRAASVYSASELLKRMDQTVDPCDDFYKFTCGNFLKSSNIPEGQSSVSSFSVTKNIMTEKLRTIMEEPIKPKDFRPSLLTKKLYKSCMNESLMINGRLKPIKSILKELGRWPVLEGKKWNESAFDWKKTVYDFNRVGFEINFFIDFTIGVDLKNSKKRVIELDEAKLGLPRELLNRGFSDESVTNYFNKMITTAAMLFGAMSMEEATELGDALKFEIELAGITVPSEMRQNVTLLYNPMTIDEMQEKYPSIPWLEYINTILAPHSTLKHDDMVVVNVPQFIENFEDLIQYTPKRVIANYAMWRAVDSSLNYLSKPLDTNAKKYAAIKREEKETKSRSYHCVDVVTKKLPIAVGALYVRKYFNEASKKNTLQMVQDLQDEFENILKQVDWMDKDTKKNALDKLKAMCVSAGYPVELKDNKKLDELFCDLEIDENHFFRSILNVTGFGRSINFKRLKQPINKPDWIRHGVVADINAYYAPPENCIQIPAGILQGAFFDAERPQYMNYGGIGFIIGHEITHGFDNEGGSFDKDGNLKEWWHQETKNHFMKKIECFTEQYGSYDVPEFNIKLNGIRTRTENIADNGGLKEAYMAYNKWVERNGEEEAQLPGLNYTGRQLFWIAAASVWCAKETSNLLYATVMTDSHAPFKFRVLGSFSNMKDFANDFKCSNGSKMNPELKCELW